MLLNHYSFQITIRTVATIILHTSLYAECQQLISVTSRKQVARVNSETIYPLTMTFVYDYPVIVLQLFNRIIHGFEKP